MKQGDLYRVSKPSSRDPKKFRVFVVVSRQVAIDSRFSTVICAPVYSSHIGLSTQLLIGIDEGLKHESSIHCEESDKLQFVVGFQRRRVAILDKLKLV
ncbi:MAG: type II toxin-antitoxin system PemK/MazF family toxin [Acidobacteriota bacterium]